MMTRTAIAIVLLLASSAHADEPEKDSGTALELSAGGTAGTLATIGLGVVLFKSSQAGSTHELGTKIMVVGAASSLLTPALGHWYAGDYVTTGTIVRTLSVATVIGGIAEAACDNNTDGGSRPGCGSGQRTLGGTLVVAGLIGYAVGMAYDVGTAGREASRYNEAHATVLPTALAGPRTTGYGVAVIGRF